MLPRIVLAVVAVVWLPARAGAQSAGTIQGTISDASDGTPVEGIIVSVQIQSSLTFATASTSAAGTFAISGLPPD